MGTTLSVVLVIVLVLASGLLRDSLRTKAIERWGRTHGFGPVPKPEHDRGRLIAWAERFRPSTASHWGIVLRGDTAGLETTIAEHEEKPFSSAARWHTLAVTRVPGLQMGAVRITRAGSPMIRRVTAAAIDAWPHDTELATIDDYVLVRVPGLITAGRLDDLLASADAARAFFTQAAARISVTR